jgi:hypothetical protein
MRVLGSVDAKQRHYCEGLNRSRNQSPRLAAARFTVTGRVERWDRSKRRRVAGLNLYPYWLADATTAPLAMTSR